MEFFHRYVYFGTDYLMWSVCYYQACNKYFDNSYLCPYHIRPVSALGPVVLWLILVSRAVTGCNMERIWIFLYMSIYNITSFIFGYSLFGQNPNLQVLNLSMCEGLSTTGLAAILGGCRRWVPQKFNMSIEYIIVNNRSGLISLSHYAWGQGFNSQDKTWFFFRFVGLQYKWLEHWHCTLETLEYLLIEPFFLLLL